MVDASSQSDANEKFVAGVDESDRSADSACVVSGEDGDEEPGDAGGWGYRRSLSREVDAAECRFARFVPNLGCEWERRNVDEK